MKPVKKKPAHYVDNKQLYADIVAYKSKVAQHEAEGKDPPRIPESIGKAIYLIANGLASLPSYAGYSYKEDMVGDAIQNCIVYGVKSFDPTRFTNPFGYFTQIAKYAFWRRLDVERHQQAVKIKNMQRSIVESDLAGEEGLATAGYDNDLTNAFIRDYEDDKAKRKVKKVANVVISNTTITISGGGDERLTIVSNVVSIVISSNSDWSDLD